MLRHSGNAAQINHRTEREHELAKLDFDGAGEIACIEKELSLGPNDPFDFAFVNFRVPAEQPERIHNVARGNGAARHLRQHRLEDHVVFRRDESDSQTRIAREFLLQRLCAIDSSESAAQGSRCRVLSCCVPA